MRAGDLERNGAVYVGRGGRGLEASPLANPFRLDREQPHDEHKDVLERNRRWLWSELQCDTPARQEIERLASLSNGVLVCLCRPVGRAEPACHADTIARAIEWWRTRALLLEPGAEVELYLATALEELQRPVAVCVVVTDGDVARAIGTRHSMRADQIPPPAPNPAQGSWRPASHGLVGLIIRSRFGR